MDYYQNNYNAPNNNHRSSGFAIASLACGIASIAALCTGVFAIPLGALGILFAVLTRRIGSPMPTMSAVGLCISCIGLVLGLIITIYACFVVFTSPTFWNELDYMFQQIYGIGLEEYMELYL